MRSRMTVLGCALVLAQGCGGADTGPAEVDLGPADLNDATIALDSDGFGHVSGGGHYFIAGVMSQVALSGKQVSSDESATGTFHHNLELGGTIVEFFGEMTCLAIDAEEGRAWIGGVVTQNRSTREPFASGEIYQPGRDIWFRILDQGNPGTDGDRTTFTGFEGSADIITSREYCDTRPWPDENARTNPITNGNLNIFP